MASPFWQPTRSTLAGALAAGLTAPEALSAETVPSKALREIMECFLSFWCSGGVARRFVGRRPAWEVSLGGVAERPTRRLGAIDWGSMLQRECAACHPANIVNPGPNDFTQVLGARIGRNETNSLIKNNATTDKPAVDVDDV